MQSNVLKNKTKLWLIQFSIQFQNVTDTTQKTQILQQAVQRKIRSQITTFKFTSPFTYRGTKPHYYKMFLFISKATTSPKFRKNKPEPKILKYVHQLPIRQLRFIPNDAFQCKFKMTIITVHKATSAVINLVDLFSTQTVSKNVMLLKLK